MHQIMYYNQDAGTLNEILAMVHLLPEVCNSKKRFGNFLMEQFHEGDGLEHLLRIMRPPDRLQRRYDTRLMMRDLLEAPNRFCDILFVAGLEIEI